MSNGAARTKFQRINFISSSSILPWIFLILVVAVGLGFVFSTVLGPWAIAITAWLCWICKTSPYLVGVTVLLILWASFRVLSRSWDPTNIVMGFDKRLSTSKCQFFLWTVAAFFSFASIYAARIGFGKIDLSPQDVPSSLLLAMGISITSAVAAKGITVSGLNSGDLAKPSGDDKAAAASDLISEDSGAVDLTKVQVLGWTVIAIGAYLVKTAHSIQTGALNQPDIDPTLMVLMGLGHGAYLGKKLITSTTPTLYKVSDARVKTSGEITLTGVNLGSTECGSLVTLDGVSQNPALDIRKWSDTEITVFIPERTKGGQHSIAVTVDSEDSNSLPIYILRTPELYSVDWKDHWLTLSGTGFAQQLSGDRFTINEKPPIRVISWTDTAIVFENPNPNSLVPGAIVNVELYLDGDKESATATLKEAQITGLQNAA